MPAFFVRPKLQASRMHKRMESIYLQWCENRTSSHSPATHKYLKVFIKAILLLLCLQNSWARPLCVCLCARAHERERERLKAM